MGAELLTSTDFYILDKNFRKILNLTQYESLMWVDKYDEPGSFEIYAPPTKEIKEAAEIGNYFQSNKSEHLMIIEKLKTTFSPNNGERLVISGRSLESILDRRVIFTQTYFHTKKENEETEGPDNLEDAIRQLLDATFIQPENEDRQIDNFVFEYTYDSAINTIDMEDMVFDKGENVLNIVQTIIKSEHLGYKITLNDQNEFVFKLIIGIDRTRDQNIVPLVEFSPMFNNLKESSYTVDAGENFKNYVFTEGEIYNSQKPLIIETGDATGLDRREIYIESSSTHENESSNLVWDTETQKWVFRKESKTLTDEEYEEVLKEEGDESFNSHSAKAEMESEVEPRLQFVYGRDFTIGDIVQIKDKSGNTSKSRVVEFIISHSASGYEEYPTFEDSEAESVTPSQTSSTGGEYSEKGKMTNDEIIREASGGVAFSHIGQIIESTTLDTEAKVKAIYGADTSWISHTGYMLRGATSGVKSGTQGQTNDGGADSQSISSVASHNHTQDSHNHTQNAHAHSPRVRLKNGGTESTGYYGIPFGGAGGTQYNMGANSTNLGAAEPVSVLNGTATNQAKTATNQATGATFSVPTLPKYKNVYIWERIA